MDTTVSTICETEGSDYGADIVSYPVVHFYGEFLCHPTKFWEVDYSPTGYDQVCIKAAITLGLWLEEEPSMIKGVKVKELATGRVWLLTGKQNMERWTYEAKWPD